MRRERGGERGRGGGRRAGEEREVLPLVLPRLFDSVAVAETAVLPVTVYPVSKPPLLHSPLFNSAFTSHLKRIEVNAPFSLRKWIEKVYARKEDE